MLRAWSLLLLLQAWHCAHVRGADILGLGLIGACLPKTHSLLCLGHKPGRCDTVQKLSRLLRKASTGRPLKH